MEAVAPVVRERVIPLATQKPERHAGQVVYHLTA